MNDTHKNRRRYLFAAQFVLGLALLGTGACTQDEEVVNELAPPAPVGYAGVDESLWTYFERFEEEGRRRGVMVDLRSARITGMLEEIERDRVLGQCNYQRGNRNHVTVDEGFWNQTSDRGREFVVFHELGHCFLLRDHLESAFTNGACTSIMRSGTGTCRDNYNRLTRDAYLEELFDEGRARDLLPR